MFKFINDIAESFSKEATERIRSPIIGTFFFSWLAFNWKTLVILVLSKKNIEDTIDYINSRTEISLLIFYPLALTVFVCFVLPWFNMFVTKYQKVPNSGTIGLLLDAKISTGIKRQELAEIKAREDLAKFKVEKEIENNIEQIKSANLDLEDKVTLLEVDIAEKAETINDLKVKRDTLTNAQEADASTIEELKNEVETQKIEIKDLSRFINDLRISERELQSKIASITDQKEALTKDNNQLSDKADHLNQQFLMLLECFPNIFKPETENKIILMKEAIDKLSEINNGTWTYKMSTNSVQNLGKVELIHIKEYIKTKT